MSLTTLTRVRSLAGLVAGVTFHDVSLQYAVDYANDLVLRKIGQPSGLSVNTVTEYPNVYDDGQTDVYLKHTPIVSIVAITNGDYAVETTDYRFDADTGMVRILRGGVDTRTFFQSWCTGLDDVQIRYAYGYTSATAPESLKRAADLIALTSFRKGKHAAAKTEKLGEYSITLDESEIPDEAVMILRRFGEDAFHH